MKCQFRTISNFGLLPSGFKAENLHSIVRSKKRLSEADAAPLFAQVVAAVAHCHEKNIVLRDLKLRKFIFKDEARYVASCDHMQRAIDFLLPDRFCMIWNTSS